MHRTIRESKRLRCPRFVEELPHGDETCKSALLVPWGYFATIFAVIFLFKRKTTVHHGRFPITLYGIVEILKSMFFQIPSRPKTDGKWKVQQSLPYCRIGYTVYIIPNLASRYYVKRKNVVSFYRERICPSLFSWFLLHSRTCFQAVKDLGFHPTPSFEHRYRRWQSPKSLGFSKRGLFTSALRLCSPSS